MSSPTAESVGVNQSDAARPLLLVLSDLPGTGKSTLARALLHSQGARRLGVVYLRVDTIEAALLNTGYTRITVEGYAVEYTIAADNLRLGLSVVADCVNPLAETRKAWAEVARQAGTKLVNMEVICSDVAEHRRRVDSRHADVTAHAGQWSPPDWDAVEKWPYHPWQTPVLQVDTAQNTSTTLTSKLLAALGLS